jgi:ATP-binding cassette, subfamily B, bacterial PglK
LSLFTLNVLAGTATQELFATLGLFAYAGMRMQPSLQKLVAGVNSTRFAHEAVEQVSADMELVLRTVARSRLQTPDGLRFERSIELRGASFNYEGAEKPSLVGVDLHIPRGAAFGVCGPTGGGKTTLIDLIVGVLEPTEGLVTVDGRDIAEDRSGWFARVGLVPQMIFLIDDTLRRNIALGQDDHEIDEGSIERAVNAAQLDVFVNALPAGLETTVGERGVRLSGGQRQRLAIARALYREPDVLIMDEGTSALDTVTERALMSTLESQRGGRTIILVAHRLQSLQSCDRIAYVEDGEVAAVGTFEGLLKSSPGFRRLATEA